MAAKLSKLKMPSKRPAEEALEKDILGDEESNEDSMEAYEAEPGELPGDELGEEGPLAGVSDEELMAEMEKRGLHSQMKGEEEAEELDEEV